MFNSPENFVTFIVAFLDKSKEQHQILNQASFLKRASRLHCLSIANNTSNEDLTSQVMTSLLVELQLLQSAEIEGFLRAKILKVNT